MNDSRPSGEAWIALPWFRDALARPSRQRAAAGAALRWLLRRSGSLAEAPDSWRVWLAQAVGLPAGALERFPEGPCVRAAWGVDLPAACWARARPVHLLAAIDHLQLAPCPTLDLTPADTAELLASINAQLELVGLRVHAAAPEDWLLQCREPLRCEAVEPDQALGRDLRAYLPRGADALRLQSIVNELQMLLHEHPVNLRRAAQGLPAVNSVWFWGFGGAEAVAPRDLPLLVSDDPWLQGLWSLHGGQVRRGMRTWTWPAPGIEPLALAVSSPAAFGGGDPLEQVERQIFVPLREALRTRRMRRAGLLLGSRTVAVEASTRWGPWRSGPRIEEILS